MFANYEIAEIKFSPNILALIVASVQKRIQKKILRKDPEKKKAVFPQIPSTRSKE